ncbi:ssDNA endonuclease and repair protein rad10 [Malassezia nana]|uniref:SsDNA endonuclease and repair protein rad10 n=1 Tax=Malassezia nana TaxID=180528 RepID=A0AAF0EKK6_9BASI|nr:ssDNA endonuclease and repair protein rad10 [Malassezia nana]
MVMMVAWSAEEAGKYLEMYKVFEQKPPDVIRGKTNQDYMSTMQSVLTHVRGINKTDVLALLTNFPSFADLSMQSPEKFLMLPGMGDVKAKNLARAFREPFQTEASKTLASTHSAMKDSHSKADEIPPPSVQGGNDASDTTDNAGDIMGALPADFDTLSEEEQLRIAMQLSMDRSE